RGGGSRQGTAWATTRCEPVRGHLFLVPGDSPLGLRLPLRSLVAKPAPLPPDRSPFEDRGPLGPRPSPGPAAPARVVSPEKARTTALCVERRAGRLHVFLPPFRHLESALQPIAPVQSRGPAPAAPV